MALTPISKITSELAVWWVHTEKPPLFAPVEQTKAKLFWERMAGQDRVFNTQPARFSLRGAGVEYPSLPLVEAEQLSPETLQDLEFS